MSLLSKAPPAYRPTRQKVVAPSVYRPQQPANSGVQLKPYPNFRTETRPAPPVYRPQGSGNPIMQLKPANTFGPETRSCRATNVSSAADSIAGAAKAVQGDISCARSLPSTAVRWPAGMHKSVIIEHPYFSP